MRTVVVPQNQYEYVRADIVRTVVPIIQHPPLVFMLRLSTVQTATCEQQQKQQRRLQQPQVPSTSTISPFLSTTTTMSPYAATRRACMVVTIRSGMRRILKRPLPSHEYIKKAVETGVYRTGEELTAVMKERESSVDDLRTIMRRFRQDIVRGTSIHDYPTEYLILEQHPPIPDPPRVSKKYMKAMHNAEHPLDRLTKKYLQRTEGLGMDNASHNNHSQPERSAEDYYRCLLGVQKVQHLHMDKTLTQKPAVVQKAYAMALKHYQVQRTEGITDAEAMQRVEELLQQEFKGETATAKKQRRESQQWRRQQQKLRRQQNQEQSQKPESPFASLGMGPTGNTASPINTLDPIDASTESPSDSLANIFGDDPRAVEGMMRWSERLQAVNYKDWTVGASTALDHWIARQVLGLSETTWQSLLEPDVEDDAALLELGRDIVAVREALFPETALDDGTLDDDYLDGLTPEEISAIEQQRQRQNEKQADIADDAESEKSITELLDSLGGLKSVYDDNKAASGVSTSSHTDTVPVWQRGSTKKVMTPEELDERTEQLVEELQEWRAKQKEAPYERWPAADQKQFQQWMQGYVATLVSESEQGRVDLDRTRQTLLSEPPVTKEEAGAFWDPLDNEEDGAEVLLDQMLAHGPPPGANLLQSAFWDLSREQQIQRLRNLGALRPILDDYTKESDRLRFWHRHADTLMQGVELEHLVVDPRGPIRASDIGGGSADVTGLSPETRFRLEKRPYQSLGDMSAWEKSRALYKVWNLFKAGRARYEEAMFREGKLGLKYSEEPEKDEEEEIDTKK